MANISVFSPCSEKYHITYYTWEEDDCLIHSNNEIFKYNKKNEVMYAYNQSDTYVDTVTDEKCM